eukprot:TRINITY_DN71568_c0_g1_i1.p1 TRINITY_DN71568_c0_g1~~TRINITY_DN71568_c0_g1_i1.p1  ORF type:complete len:481 (+),score=60.00 TRINITY_DN71568_c0_g1_i1:52-1494(+)
MDTRKAWNSRDIVIIVAALLCAIAPAAAISSAPTAVPDRRADGQEGSRESVWPENVFDAEYVAHQNSSRSFLDSRMPLVEREMNLSRQVRRAIVFVGEGRVRLRKLERTANVAQAARHAANADARRAEEKQGEARMQVANATHAFARANGSRARSCQQAHESRMLAARANALNASAAEEYGNMTPINESIYAQNLAKAQDVEKQVRRQVATLNATVTDGQNRVDNASNRLQSEVDKLNDRNEEGLASGRMRKHVDSVHDQAKVVMNTTDQYDNEKKSLRNASGARDGLLSAHRRAQNVLNVSQTVYNSRLTVVENARKRSETFDRAADAAGVRAESLSRVCGSMTLLTSRLLLQLENSRAALRNASADATVVLGKARLANASADAAWSAVHALNGTILRKEEHLKELRAQLEDVRNELRGTPSTRAWNAEGMPDVPVASTDRIVGSREPGSALRRLSMFLLYACLISVAVVGVSSVVAKA